MAAVAPAYIDEKINKCLILTSNLRAQKNSYLPIFRLPPETLANIFIHGARDYHESNVRSTFRIPHWVNVSYVCRHWRDVALNCPTLWTYHFIVSLRWTEELVARSKQASLKICIHFDCMKTSPWWSTLVEKLLCHTERFQELRLFVPAKVLPSNLSLCAPRLQILDIDGSRSLPSEWTLTINDRDIPLLCTLKLAGCPLPWHSPNLSGLTTLFLHHLPIPKQNIGEFLPMLNRMQRLTTLYLAHALASACGFLSSAFDVSPKICLPRLARLFVIAPLSTVVALLSCVNIPLKTELRLTFQPEDGSSVEDYAKIPLVLAQRFSQVKDLSSFSPTIRSLGIRYTPSRSTFTLCASEHGDCNPSVSMARPQWDSGLSLGIFLQRNQSMTISKWDHITSDICCSIPLTDVQTLNVTYPPLSPDIWRKMLGHLHRLRHMKLSEGYMPNLVSLLALPADEPVGTPRGHITSSDHDPTPGHIFVPALEELELHHITFASQDDFSVGDVSEQSLLDALATRKALRPRLSMAACHFEDEESGMDDDASVYPFEFYVSDSSDEYY